MSRVGIWFDGGGQFGFGNICRSAEMARELAARGHDVLSVPLSGKAKSLSPSRAVDRGRVDVVLLDVPYSGGEEVIRAHALGAKVVALDYEGEEAPDVVVSLQDSRPMPIQTRRHVVVEYAIIRTELRAAKGAVCKSGDVLVVLGGGDSEGLSNEIARRLHEVPLCVVQGPNAGTLQAGRENVRVLQNPSCLPELMSGCPWAVTSGGTTMLEMLYFGKAIHVVPRTAGETEFAQQFLKKGALLGVGLEALREPTADHMLSCERRGPELIDGCGAHRIADIVEEFL